MLAKERLRGRWPARHELVVWITALIFVLAPLLLIESGLRILASLGWVAHLDDFLDPADFYSMVYHHRRTHDAETSVTSLPAQGCAGGLQTTLLFQGDSWMHGGGIVAGFAAELERRRDDGACFRLVNAGTGSFAPSPILMQFKKLNATVRPDFIVTSIDETDLMDEWLRYRDSRIVDDAGALVAVVPGPSDIPHLVFSYAIHTLEQQPLYTIRLLERLWLQHVLLPRLQRDLQRRAALPSADSLLAPQRSLRPYVDFAEPIAQFRTVLMELLDTYRGLAPGATVVLIHHPHRFALEDATQATRYRFSVAPIIEELAAAAGVLYFSGADLLATTHGPALSATFLPSDPFSHLSHQGYVRYGEALARYLAAETSLLRGEVAVQHSRPAVGVGGARAGG